MQSKQSKLMMTALVAAKAATALEITEGTALVETQQDTVKTFFAQTRDDEDAPDMPPGNDNPNDNNGDEPDGSGQNQSGGKGDEPDEDPSNNGDEDPSFDSKDEEDINEKIELLADGAIGGLNAKQDWIVEKLQFFTRTRLQQLRELDETCRVLMDERKEFYTNELNQDKDDAVADMRECREDYINELLEFKEALKDKLQGILNQTIWDIKEMKVEGVLNEAGIPTEEHKTTLDGMIEDRINQFNTDSDNIVNVDWMQRVLDEDGREEEFHDCLEDAKEDYMDAYNDDANENGYGPDFREEYEKCYTQMEEFKSAARTELQDMCDGFTDDAEKQVHIAKSEFKKMFMASIEKLHNLTLTEEQRMSLKELVMDKQSDFVDLVTNWKTGVMNKLISIHDDFEEDLCEIVDEFEDDIDTTACPEFPMTTPECSVLNWLAALDVEN